MISVLKELILSLCKYREFTGEAIIVNLITIYCLHETYCQLKFILINNKSLIRLWCLSICLAFLIITKIKPKFVTHVLFLLILVEGSFLLKVDSYAVFLYSWWYNKPVTNKLLLTANIHYSSMQNTDLVNLIHVLFCQISDDIMHTFIFISDLVHMWGGLRPLKHPWVKIIYCKALDS